jgi:GNAT superfamily N-acetyltransferase
VARTIDHALAGEHALIRELSDRILHLPWGFAFFDEAVPRVYHANALHVTAMAGVTAAELMATAEKLFAGLEHRRIVIEHEELWAELAPAFYDAHWTHSTEMYMAHRRDPDRVDIPSSLQEIAFEELAASEDAFIASEPWGRDPAVRAQFTHRNRRAAHAAGERIFAAMDQGAPAAWAKLRTLGDLLQIEDVATLPHARGLGLGRGVVTAALQAALERTPPMVFLIADDDDWPKQLYAKLGFEGIGRVAVFDRPLPESVRF